MRNYFSPLMMAAVILLFLQVPIPSLAAPPAPPQGKHWEKNKMYSDEFNGTTLDTDKWHNQHPYWEGRPPARFKTQAVTVKDGSLRLTNYKLPAPEYARGNRYTIGGGAVVSKNETAHYGYYECRMKASEISMSSTFWMKNRWNRSQCPNNKTELDIIECIGGSTTDFATTMHSNTHYIHNACGTNERYISEGHKAAVGGSVADAFHVYGAWWEDANNIHFYIDDKYVYTIHPRTDVSDHPFDRPMFICMVTETYNWHAPPTDADFKNPSLNKTTYYDWIRVWTLKDGEEEEDEDTIALNNAPTRIPSRKSYTVNVDYTATTSRDVVLAFWSPTKWLGGGRKRVKAGSATISLTVNLSTAPAEGTGYRWHTGIRPVGTDWRQDIARDRVDNVVVQTDLDGQLISNGEYQIRNIANDRNLAAVHWAQWLAVDVVPDRYKDQRWIIRHLGEDIYEFKLSATWAGDKYLDVPNGKCENGTQVSTYSRADSEHQKWQIVQNGSHYMIRPSHCPSQALDIRPSDRYIHTWKTSTSNNNQQWRFIQSSP